MGQFFKFILFQYLTLVLSFYILHLYFPVDGAIDLQFIQPWISAQGDFYLKMNWYLDRLNHHYLKVWLICIYIGYIGLWIASFKIERLKANRWTYFYFYMLLILGTSLIGFLKSQSAFACPWDMIIVNQSSYTWDFNQVAGHCFPGGHASTGFALMVGYFVYRFKNYRRALFFLVASIILGMGMGWAQVMRGAHFFSHNLWTGWFIWLLNVLVYCITYPYFKYRIFEQPENAKPQQ